MKTYSDSFIISLATDLLQEHGLVSQEEATSGQIEITPIASDGSTRRFWRCKVLDRSLCVVAAPLTTTDNEVRESKSAWFIGNHLRAKGCAVPELFGWDEESGMLLFDDLGDQRLHSLVTPGNGLRVNDRQIVELYTEVVKNLCHMQVAGSADFNTDWCWDTRCYNKELMLSRESGYFLTAFWLDLLQQSVPPGVDEDFQNIADLAATANANYFLHRDFQSRNIMVNPKGYNFIDFQGGRRGPLGYDLASLLIDPYCALSYEVQEELLEMYLNHISEYVDIDRTTFRNEYHALALQRNLQILGAFAFLSTVRKKSFFKAFIQPALLSAQLRLEQPVFCDLNVVKAMINSGLQAIA
ncbi:aminoglycoside phosphotransferase family protein [Desulforhopalus sp. 52FAK]